MSTFRVTLDFDVATYGSLRRFVELAGWEDDSTRLWFDRDDDGDPVGLSTFADISQIQPYA